MKIVVVASMEVLDKFVKEDIDDALNLILPYFGDNVTVDVREDD